MLIFILSLQLLALVSVAIWSTLIFFRGQFWRADQKLSNSTANLSKSPEIGGDQEGNWRMEFVPDWNTKKFSGAMNIPFSDTFAMRIAAQKESSDGWVYNAYLNEDAPATESEAIRATMLWELDNMEVNLKLSSLNTEKKGSEAGIYKYQLAAPFPAMATATPPYTGAVINWLITNAFFPNQICNHWRRSSEK